MSTFEQIKMAENQIDYIDFTLMNDRCLSKKEIKRLKGERARLDAFCRIVIGNQAMESVFGK